MLLDGHLIVVGGTNTTRKVDFYLGKLPNQLEAQAMHVSVKN